jgi:hypothetical protein
MIDDDKSRDRRVSCTSASLVQPKYVALDTSTWIDLFKRRTDPEAKEIITVLNSGQIIPYVSFEHVLELVQHSDQTVRLDQLDFFRVINHVGSPKPISFPAPWRNSPVCGSYQDVQEPEVSVLLRDSTLTLDQVVEKVRPAAIAGLASGVDFANDSVLRDIARTGRATSLVSVNQAAVSMLFAALQNPNDVIPRAGTYTMLDQQAAEQRKPQMIATFAQQFRQAGMQNPDQQAAQVVEQSFQLIFQHYDPSSADPFRDMVVKALGLNLTRLPAGSTQHDFILETLFRSRMAIHERRMTLPDGAAYNALTRHMLPSFVAWFAFDQAARSNMPTPQGSNMIDFPLAAFALYIDKVQVDKRVLHQAEMAARQNPFLERVKRNLFRTADLKSLLSALKSL